MTSILIKDRRGEDMGEDKARDWNYIKQKARMFGTTRSWKSKEAFSARTFRGSTAILTP